LASRFPHDPEREKKSATEVTEITEATIEFRGNLIFLGALCELCGEIVQV
jgi:hypothetical protein